MFQLKLKGNCFLSSNGIKLLVSFGIFCISNGITLFFFLSYDSMLFISIGMTLFIITLFVSYDLLLFIFSYQLPLKLNRIAAARCLINMVYLMTCAYIRS